MLNSVNFEHLTFEEAIDVTQTLLKKMKANELSPAEIESTIASLVKTENGARGFFVSYLTDDDSLADHPTEEIIHALQTSPEIVGELLVKNLVMSTAMIITHRRNNDQESAQGSARVRHRSKDLIEKLSFDTIATKLDQLKTSLKENQGEYTDFLKRWKYDSEQREAMYQTLLSLEN